MRSHPLTPPPERDDSLPEYRRPELNDITQHLMNRGSDDNTAAGMALSQEESMYLSPVHTPETHAMDEDIPSDKDKMEVTQEATKADNQAVKLLSSGDVESLDQEDSLMLHSSPIPATGLGDIMHKNRDRRSVDFDMMDDHDSIIIDERDTNEADRIVSHTRNLSNPHKTHHDHLPLPGLAKVDLTLNRSSILEDWDFTRKRIEPNYPSSLFRPFSKYSGSQQSDRQIYNVDVTILTVDMDQCSLSGYLMIRGLTPEHEMLQTFFTGEIIGGPNQRYGFRTRDSTWGATDKTDMIHWARFPAWRHLSPYARRDIDFNFPLDNEPWWQQEHIYMRWKEHFLVPDHKTRSIQGASFEGFYYICLNQVEGSISGIYFHSKSEKYQQLELKHEGKRGVWGPGFMPLVEFR